MRTRPTAHEAGCPVCTQRVIVEDGRLVRHRVRPTEEQPWADECWGSYKRPVEPGRVAVMGDADA